MMDAVTAARGRLYARVLRLAGHRHAERALAAVAFTENSFFPVPPDAMIVPMVLARRTRWARIELPVKTLDQRARHHLHRMVVDRIGLGLVCRRVP